MPSSLNKKYIDISYIYKSGTDRADGEAEPTPPAGIAGAELGEFVEQIGSYNFV